MDPVLHSDNSKFCDTHSSVEEILLVATAKMVVKNADLDI